VGVYPGGVGIAASGLEGMSGSILTDLIALIFFYAAWSGYAMYANENYSERPNLMQVMNQMRMTWMRQLLKHPNRIADAGLIGNLLRSISFFANTSVFILMGLVTMLGYKNSAMDMLKTIPIVAPTTPLLWDIKLLNLVVIFVYAFFKFTWSLRQYNYCCVLIGAAPMPTESPEIHEDYASKAGLLLTNASSHFNMGIRAYYFGMAAISWFVNPVVFIATTALVVFVVYRREFLSDSLNNLHGMSNGY